MITEVDVRAALDRVIHPTFGLSLIALNMVRAVRMSADRIEVDLVMNCPGCPAGEVTLAQARQDLAALSSGIVRLNLLPQIWTPPWEQTATKEKFEKTVVGACPNCGASIAANAKFCGECGQPDQAREVMRGMRREDGGQSQVLPRMLGEARLGRLALIKAGD